VLGNRKKNESIFLSGSTLDNDNDNFDSYASKSDSDNDNFDVDFHNASMSDNDIHYNDVYYNAYIMELGQTSLRDHYKNDKAKLTDEWIREVAKDIALAVRDLHRGLWALLRGNVPRYPNFP
jgi:hypothetical protein